jgi:tetratricopeptide (TPR) repeat protein
MFPMVCPPKQSPHSSPVSPMSLWLDRSYPADMKALLAYSRSILLQCYNPAMHARFSRKYLLAVPTLCILAVLVYNVPFVHSRLAWRIDNLRIRIQYAINPPEQVVFLPQEQAALENQVNEIVNATLTAIAPTTTPTLFIPTPTQPGPTETPLPTATPTLSPTPLPTSIRLTGVHYEDQHNRYNYCGPANLSMALTFWGWDGNRDTVGEYVKTNVDDKNVMPYELQDFVLSQTTYGALIRFGGDISLLKKLVAAGFPVITEKGYYTYDMTGRYGWLGHYQFVTGYDESKGVLVVQDTYIDKGENHEFSFADFNSGWRSFDFLFMVVYPLDRESQLLALLGNYTDLDWSSRRALEIATDETTTLSGVDQYFSAFNVGTSHVNLKEYVDAAYAYDYAFQLYAGLPNDDLRPFRMLWYQTGPYFAYYYSGRYQDVIDLANATFNTIGDDVLEESWYWRGMGKLALGDTTGAINDFRESVRLHPGFAAGVYQLSQLGVSP